MLRVGGPNFGRASLSRLVARALRHQPAEAIQHVTLRTNRGLPLFDLDEERRLFLRLVRETVQDSGWACLSYCLMWNHVHLVVQHQSPNLSAGMQRLTTRYARHYNDRRGRYGHVFQGRFGSRIVTRESYLREVMRYVALNPVRASLCNHAGEYPWGAHRALLGQTSTSLVSVERALRPFGTTVRDARAAYAAFVLDRSADARFGAEYDSPLPADRTATPTLPDLARTLDRDALILTAHREHGYSLAAIARTLGCARSTVTRRFAKLERSAQRGV